MADSESKYGFKTKDKALETLQLLESEDMPYRKLTVRGLLGRAKRVLSMTKAEDKINNIKSAIEVFEKWLEQNGGGTANQNSATNNEDKVESVPGLGFKDKQAAEETLRILEGRDPEYQRLAIKGLIGSSKRVLSLTKDEGKIKNIKEAVDLFDKFLEKFELENFLKNNRAYLAYNIIEQIIQNTQITDNLAEEFLSEYGGEKAKGNYKHLRTLFPKDDVSKSWDIVRNSHLTDILSRIKSEELPLFEENGAPTAVHLELIQWAYSPHVDKLKKYLDHKSEKKAQKRKSDSYEANDEQRNSPTDNGAVKNQAESHEDESPTKKKRVTE